MLDPFNMDCFISFGSKSLVRMDKCVYYVTLSDTNDLFYILMVGTFPWMSRIVFMYLNAREEIRSRYLKKKLASFDCHVVLSNEQIPSES